MATGPIRRASLRILSRSARETADLGARLGRALRPGDLVALVGELGSGKTQLVRGICRGAGVDAGRVASPTFAIVSSYRGRLPIHHADLYRVGDEEELFATGFYDLLGGDGAVLVEWADRVPGALPEERLELTLTHDAGRPSVRHLRAVGTGERHAVLAGRLRRRRGAQGPARRRVRRRPPRRGGRRQAVRR